MGCRAGVGFRALEEGERRGGGETRTGRDEEGEREARVSSYILYINIQQVYFSIVYSAPFFLVSGDVSQGITLHAPPPGIH